MIYVNDTVDKTWKVTVKPTKPSVKLEDKEIWGADDTTGISIKKLSKYAEVTSGVRSGQALVREWKQQVFDESPHYENMTLEEYFMPGYSEAVVRATEIAEEEDKEVLSTYERLSSPFMLAMYAAKEPPEEVLQTAQYRLAAGEFYVADRFGRYTFGIDELPADLKNTVLILYKDEEAQHRYPEEEYEKEAFGNYVVVSERLP